MTLVAEVCEAVPFKALQALSDPFLKASCASPCSDDCETFEPVRQPRGFTKWLSSRPRAESSSSSGEDACFEKNETPERGDRISLVRPFEVILRNGVSGEYYGRVQVCSMDSARQLIERAQKVLEDINGQQEFRFVFDGRPLRTKGTVGRLGLIPGSVIEVVCLGLQAATASPGGAGIWCLTTGQCRESLGRPASEVTSLACSRDGKEVAIGCADGSLQLWRRDAGDMRHSVQAHACRVTSLCFAPKGNSLLSASRDGAAKLWKPKDDGLSTAATIQCSYPLQSAAFSPDAGMVVTATDTGLVLVWAVGGSRFPLAQLKKHSAAALDVAFSDDGLAVATASEDCTACVWRPEGSGAFLWGRWTSGVKEPQELCGHEASVTAVAFSSPPGQQVLTASADTTLRLWCASSGECLRTFTGHKEAVASAAFARCGAIFVSVASDGIMRLWSMEGDCLKEIPTQEKDVSVIAMLPWM